MPINEPVPHQKIAPASLAFNTEFVRRGGVSATYQASVRIVNETQDTQLAIQERAMARAIEIAQANVIDAERRAKNFVGQYSESFEWDYSDDVVVTTLTADPLGFDHEVIRCAGAYMVGTISTGGAKFQHHVVKGNTGVWFYYCHIQMVFTAGMNVPSARISIYKNDVQWRVLDALDADMGGDHVTYIQDCILGGSCQVPVVEGDKIEFRIYIESFAGAGDQTLGFPTSAYGFGGGFRLRCDDEIIDNPETGDTYTFV